MIAGGVVEAVPRRGRRAQVAGGHRRAAVGAGRRRAHDLTPGPSRDGRPSLPVEGMPRTGAVLVVRVRPRWDGWFLAAITTVSRTPLAIPGSARGGASAQAGGRQATPSSATTGPTTAHSVSPDMPLPPIHPMPCPNQTAPTTTSRTPTRIRTTSLTLSFDGQLETGRAQALHQRLTDPGGRREHPGRVRQSIACGQRQRALTEHHGGRCVARIPLRRNGRDVVAPDVVVLRTRIRKNPAARFSALGPSPGAGAGGPPGAGRAASASPPAPPPEPPSPR